MTFDTALWRILLSHAVGCAAMPINSLRRVTGDGRWTGRRGRRGQPPIQLSFDGPSLVVVVLSAHWLIFLLMFAPNARWATIRVASNGTAPAPAPASNSSTIPYTKSMGIAVDSCCGHSSTKPSYLANWRRLSLSPSFTSTSFAPSMQNVCWFICITAWHFYWASHNCLPTLSIALIKLINRIH